MAKATGRGTGKSLSKQQRRRRILNAARKVFSEKGYHRSTVSDIVAECNIAQGTFYLYFSGKREVFGILLDEFTQSILKAFFIPGAEEVSTQREVCERFMRVARSALNMFDSNRDLARLFMLEAAAREPGFEDKVASFYKKLISGAAANIGLWMDRGLLRKADPTVIAHCVTGMVERLMLQWMNGSLDINLEEATAEMVRFELYGILKKPAEVFEK